MHHSHQLPTGPKILLAITSIYNHCKETGIEFDNSVRKLVTS